jgi:hypothetical protein
MDRAPVSQLLDRTPVSQLMDRAPVSQLLDRAPVGQLLGRAAHTTVRDKRRQIKTEGALRVAVAVGRGQFGNQDGKRPPKNSHIPLKRDGTATHNSTTNSRIPLKRDETATHNSTKLQHFIRNIQTVPLSSILHFVYMNCSSFNTVSYNRDTPRFYQPVTGTCQ